MLKAEIIFFVVVMINIIGFYFIIKNFFRKCTVSGKTSSFSTATKVFSVILNLALAVCMFGAVALGICLIDTMDVSDYMIIFTYNFKMGLLLLETVFFLPYGINLFLYKVWYRKNNLHKWWIFPSLIIGLLAFIITVFSVITRGFISNWSQAEWRVTSEFI